MNRWWIEKLVHGLGFGLGVAIGCTLTVVVCKALGWA